MSSTPADIITENVEGVTSAIIVDTLAGAGLEVSQATARNWLTGRSIPADRYRLALVTQLGLPRDRFLSACAAARAV